MDFFKSQFERIQQQLAGLTPSQKMLSAALVVIMVMTLWLSGRYAGTPEMEPLLTSQLSQDDIARIGMQLTAAGIDHKVGADGKVLVSADRKIQALANLGYANLMPKDFSSGFDQIIGKLTAWDGNDRQNAMFNRGKELSLEQVLSQFPGVAKATVIIDPRSQRRIGEGGDLQPTATVALTLRDAGANAAGAKTLAKSAAHFVSGAHAGLEVGRIKVSVNGKHVPVSADGTTADGIAGDSLMELQATAERQLSEKIRNYLSHIRDVQVAVTVRVKNSTEQKDSVTYDKDKSLITEQETISRNRENSSKSAGPAEAGAVPNTGQSIAAAAGGSDRSDTDANEATKNAIYAATERMTVRTPAGEATPAGVSVMIPRSWLVMVAKGGKQDGPEPTEDVLDKVAAAQSDKIRKALGAFTLLTKPEQINVDTFFDAVAPPAVETAQLAGVGTITAVVGGNVKEIMLGGLALVSLLMMSMMVRKGAPSPAAVPAARLAAPSSAASAGPSLPGMLGSMEALVGEVSAQDPMLDGMELDDDSVKTQQMLSQVTSMVGENPDTAAQLVKRWMNQR